LEVSSSVPAVVSARNIQLIHELQQKFEAPVLLFFWMPGCEKFEPFNVQSTLQIGNVDIKLAALRTLFHGARIVQLFGAALLHVFVPLGIKHACKNYLGKENA
jgi:hypothetical protein